MIVYILLFSNDIQVIISCQLMSGVKRIRHLKNGYGKDKQHIKLKFKISSDQKTSVFIIKKILIMELYKSTLQ